MERDDRHGEPHCEATNIAAIAVTTVTSIPTTVSLSCFLACSSCFLANALCFFAENADHPPAASTAQTIIQVTLSVKKAFTAKLLSRSVVDGVDYLIQDFEL